MTKEPVMPFYDPNLSYEANFTQGPFGVFSDGGIAEQPGEPQSDFLGHKVYLPFGIPAGPLINAAFVKAAFAKGFDLCVYKTVRTREYPCHQWPNVLAVHLDGELTSDRAAQPLKADTHYFEPLSITNSFGVPSKDPDWWQADMTRAVQSAGKGQILIGSFQGTKLGKGRTDFIKDYALGARLVKETGAPILEANLSCPNEGSGNLLCFDVEVAADVAEAIKNTIGNTPLLLKLAFFPDTGLLRRLVKRVGRLVQGFSAINTIPAAIVDQNGNQALPGEGRLHSGVCGKAIAWAGLDMAKRLSKLRDELHLDYTIVGVGGVSALADYSDYRKAGADAVMSATGAMWNPYLAQEIKHACRRKLNA